MITLDHKCDDNEAQACVYARDRLEDVKDIVELHKPLKMLISSFECPFHRTKTHDKIECVISYLK